MIKIRVPTPLRSYTGNRAEIQAQGSTLSELLAELDRLHPGIRFRIISEQDRIREHIRIFVNRSAAQDLSVRIHPGDQVEILCALSGG